MKADRKANEQSRIENSAGKTNILRTFVSFVKVGVIGFGGGSALIPIIEREIVESRRMIEPDDYLKHTVIANITPGALPVKLGASCGYQMSGVFGSLAGAYGVVLPGTLLTVIITALFASLGERMIAYFNYASVGITAFIVFLLMSYIVRTCGGAQKKINFSLCALAFLITGGKEVRLVLSQVLNIEISALGTPLFDISTIHLMIAAFWMIIMAGSLRGKWEYAAGIAVSLAYCFCVGKTGTALGLGTAGSVLLAVMAVCLIALKIVRRDPNSRKSAVKGFSGKAMAAAAVFVALPVVLCAVTVLILDASDPGYLLGLFANAALSTVTSFGGGEAYVSVADGFFVQEGYIASEILYTQLVPVANALPGPILVKIAAGTGYICGLQYGTAGAWMAAITVATVTVGVCCAVAIVFLQFYDAVKEAAFIRNLKSYILPVICGMLISTSCSMFYEAMHITAGEGIAGWIALPVLILWTWGLSVLHKKLKLHDLILLLGSAALGLGVLLV